MEDSGGQVVFPTLVQICQVNRRMIDSFGGSFTQPDNLLNRGSLEYILIVVAFPIVGVEPYPTVKEKASAVAHRIISQHIFWDGNKRTGIHIAWEFLQANGIPVDLDDTIVDLAVAIAGGEAEYEDLLAWFHEHQ